MKNLTELTNEMGISPQNINSSIEFAKKWILYSGIQNLGKRTNSYGAFNSWYDADTKIYPYAYSEVSGYAITLFLFLNSIKSDDELIWRARVTADWILNFALDTSTKEAMFRFYYHLDDFSPRHSYAFDNSIVISGFVNLYRETKNELYLNTAKDLADRLISIMQNNDGSFYSYYDMEDRIRLVSPDVWSKQSGAYHAKIAIAMLRLFDVTRDEKYKESALKISDWAFKQQLEDGCFISKQVDNSIILHPNCYAFEGLLYAGLYLKKDEYLKSAIKGIEWLFKSQLKNGGIPSEFKNGVFLSSERVDALAQTIRLAIITLNHSMLNNEYLPPLTNMVKRLLEFQCKNSSLKEKGGFYYLIYADETPMNHLNSWAAMFAIQALYMFKQLQEKKEDFDLNFLL